jgi:LacI family transcriptional regulator
MGEKMGKVQRARKRYRVAVFIETTRAYGRELIRGIAQYNREHWNWEIEFTPSGINEPIPTWIKNWQGDGILARINDKRFLRLLLQKDIPVIDLRRSFSSPRIPQIGPNDHTVIKILYEFFRSRGFQQFAFVGLPKQEHPSMDRRRKSFREIVKKDRLSFWELEISATELLGNQNKGLRKLIQWLKHLPPHIAVIACNDDLALQVLNACQQAGLAVPGDVAVSGIGNDECLCELAMPTLTSVDLNPKRIGYEAAGMLQKIMSENVVLPQETLLEPNFVVTRMSTNIISTQDSIVNQALQYISSQSCAGIQVRDVLQYVQCSRVALENRFKKFLGHTIFQEMLYIRLQRVKELLTTTDLSIKEIAALSGFDYPEHLMRVFHEHFGQTMKSFRKDYRQK